MTMSDLEHQEIRGITNRLAVIIISCTITLTASFVGVYFGLKNDIQHVMMTQDIRKAEVNGQLDIIHSDIQGIKTQVQNLTTTVQGDQQKKN